MENQFFDPDTKFRNFEKPNFLKICDKWFKEQTCEG